MQKRPYANHPGKILRPIQPRSPTRILDPEPPSEGHLFRALKQKLGRVEEADGGTIFLDEIGDMSRPLQAKLLRFLEDGSFTRVGGND